MEAMVQIGRQMFGDTHVYGRRHADEKTVVVEVGAAAAEPWSESTHAFLCLKLSHRGPLGGRDVDAQGEGWVAAETGVQQNHFTRGQGHHRGLIVRGFR